MFTLLRISMTDQNLTILCLITETHRSALNLVAAKITQDHLKTSSVVTQSLLLNYHHQKLS